DVSAIDDYALPGDVARIITGQKHGDARHLLRLPKPAQGYRARIGFYRLLVEPVYPPRLYGPEHHAVHPYTGREDPCEHLGLREDRSLRARVHEALGIAHKDGRRSDVDHGAPTGHQGRSALIAQESPDYVHGHHLLPHRRSYLAQFGIPDARIRHARTVHQDVEP